MAVRHARRSKHFQAEMESGTEPFDVSGHESRSALVLDECFDQGGVTLLRGVEVAVVGSVLPRRIPDALDRVELGGVRREATEFDAMSIGGEPGGAFSTEVVAGGVVDDEEHLAAVASDETLLLCAMPT